MDEHVDYGLALADAEAFLGRLESMGRAADLPAILAAWAAEGEYLAYPAPALDPERRSAEVAA